MSGEPQAIFSETYRGGNRHLTETRWQMDIRRLAQGAVRRLARIGVTEAERDNEITMNTKFEAIAALT
jgi:hypothetical protein